MLSQLNLFLLSFGALQGILIGIVFLRRSNQPLVSTYFILILTVLSLQLTFKVISKVWLMHNFRTPYLMSYSLPFLIGPLLYLYIKARAFPKFEKIDFFHGIPFLASLGIMLLIDYGIVPNHRIRFPGYTQGFLQALSLLIYSVASCRIVKKRANEPGNILFFICSLSTIELMLIIALSLMYVYYGQYPDLRLVFVGLTFLVYWITDKQLSQPGFFYRHRNGFVLPANSQPCEIFKFRTATGRSRENRATLQHSMREKKSILGIGSNDRHAVKPPRIIPPSCLASPE